MKTDHLQDEEKKQSYIKEIFNGIFESAGDNIGQIIGLSFLLIIILITFAYISSFYESCNGKVVKGVFGGLECIERGYYE